MGGPVGAEPGVSNHGGATEGWGVGGGPVVGHEAVWPVAVWPVAVWPVAVWPGAGVALSHAGVARVGGVWAPAPEWGEALGIAFAAGSERSAG